MSHSHKNTSSGESGMDTSGAKYLGIGENKAHTPPSGASNSYEMVRKKIDAKDSHHIERKHYTREKMENK